MASLALGIAGAVIGSFFGLGALGFAVGSLLGSLLFPQQGGSSEGPRLSSLHITNSSYGTMVPFVWGTMRVPGNVIWQTDLVEHKHEEHHGKGGGGQTITTYTYTASFALYLCVGPINGIRKIWADGTTIWSADGTVGGDLPCTLYVGDEDQLPDPTIEAAEGAGNVPAHRGYAYVVFKDFELGDYGNRIPNLNFEVQVKGGTDAPLFIVKQDTEEPLTTPNPNSQDRWSFRTNEGPVGNTYPAITHWALDGTDIRIREVPRNFQTDSGIVYTYDGNTLEAIDWNEDGDSFPYVTNTELGNIYYPIGNYVYTDGTTTPLWGLSSSIRTVQAGLTNVALAAGFADCPRDSPPTASANFGYDAGIPTGLFLNSSALSQDGKTLVVFTSDDTLHLKEWYRIVNGAVVAHGTVTPNLTYIGAGAAGANVFDVSMLENNGKYLWHYTSNGSFLRLYVFDDSGNFAVDSGAGTLRIPYYAYSRTGLPQQSAVFYPAVYVPQEGWCGICVGRTLALVTRKGGPDTTLLSEVVGDLCGKAGMAGDEFDVSQLTDVVDGYLVTTQQAVRESIATLRSPYYFDGVESAGVVKFVKRAPIAAVEIPIEDLAAHSSDSGLPTLVGVTRVQEADLPQQVSVSYINGAADYQVGTQISQRQTVETKQIVSLQLAVNMSDAKGKEVSNTLLLAAWTERTQLQTFVSRKWSYLEPTDVIKVNGYEMRVLNKTDAADGTIKLEGVANDSGVWIPGTVAGIPSVGIIPVTPRPQQPTDLVLLDIPMVYDSDDPEGLRAGMAGRDSANWSGAALFQSVDGGANFSEIASAVNATTMGTVTALPTTVFGGGNMFDESSVFEVQIGEGGGDLAGASAAAVLNGANAALLGPEILQFKNATLIGDGLYRLTGFLRGRRGTEWAIPHHSVGERFVMLATTVDVDADIGQLGLTLDYKAVSLKGTLLDADDVPFQNTGNATLPYAPCHLGGWVDADGDVTLKWTRRTRIGGAWKDFNDVPLSEPAESYVVQITDSTYSNIARVVSGLTSPEFVYTAAMQTADFGDTQANVYFTVGQLGEYKLGNLAYGVVKGAGSTDDSVGTPTNPYNGGGGPPPGTAGCTMPVQNVAMPWSNVSVAINPPAGYDVVIAFTTQASPVSGQGALSGGAALESGGATIRHVVLATSPCGAPLSSLSKVDAVSFSIPFYMTGNPDPSKYPTLDVSTTYYLTVEVDVASPSVVQLTLPS